MNHWLQTKQYHCPACGEKYLHDQAYAHACFRCSARRVNGAIAPTVNGSTP